MRSVTFRCLPLAMVLALLAPPAGAMASSTPSPQQLSAPAQLRAMVRERTSRGGHQPAFHPVFWLKSRNGYVIEVAGYGDNVVIYVLPGLNASVATSYVARGTVTRGRLEASFGKFGKVSMRFRPSMHRTWIKPNRVCRGPGRFIDRVGTYVGEFRFRGEGGYISVKARRAKGQVSSVAPQCERGRSARRVELATHPSENGFFGPELPYLDSEWRSGVAAAKFVALKGRKTIFIASTEQAHGKFAIFRVAIVPGSSAKVFTVSNALTSARVSPPGPFSGTGTYRAAPDGTKTWTGSLAVNFPGADHYRLTPPPFEASVGMTSDPFFFLF